MRTEALFKFIHERYLIWQRRQAGAPRPWTQDLILQRYRFTNVYREYDTVTKWIAENWRQPHENCKDLWFALTVARMYNRPATLAAIGFPIPYRPEHIRKTVNTLMRSGNKVFSGAYMIRCDCQEPGKTKTDYLLDKVFAPMWRNRTELRPRPGDTLAFFHSGLKACFGMGSFTAAQVVADMKYVAPLNQATDWWNWAAPGPGSQRGLNRFLGWPVKQPWKLSAWQGMVWWLLNEMEPLLAKANMPRMHAQDLQNCLCEFDKYERARLGQGRPKQLYMEV